MSAAALRRWVHTGCRRRVSLAMEAIGDITASAEVSRVEVDGPEFDSRIQGGVLVRLFPPSLSFSLSSLSLSLFEHTLFEILDGP